MSISSFIPFFPIFGPVNFTVASPVCGTETAPVGGTVCSGCPLGPPEALREEEGSVGFLKSPVRSHHTEPADRKWPSPVLCFRSPPQPPKSFIYTPGLPEGLSLNKMPALWCTCHRYPVGTASCPGPYWIGLTLELSTDIRLRTPRAPRASQCLGLAANRLTWGAVSTGGVCGFHLA